MRDNLSRVYCRDELFMNPPLAKGENSGWLCAASRASTAGAVSIFSQISPVALEAVVSICRGDSLGQHRKQKFHFWPG